MEIKHKYFYDEDEDVVIRVTHAEEGVRMKVMSDYLAFSDYPVMRKTLEPAMVEKTQPEPSGTVFDNGFNVHYAKDADDDEVSEPEQNTTYVLPKPRAHVDIGPGQGKPPIEQQAKPLDPLTGGRGRGMSNETLCCIAALRNGDTDTEVADRCNVSLRVVSQVRGNHKDKIKRAE